MAGLTTTQIAGYNGSSITIAVYDTGAGYAQLVTPTDATGNAITIAKDATLTSLLGHGQATMANSVPVALASDQSSIDVVLQAGSAAIGSVSVSSLPALPAGGNAIGSVSVSSLPALPAGGNSIGQVTANGGTPQRISAVQSAIAVAATTTSTTILTANSSRSGVVLTNTSTGDLYLLYGSGTASSTAFSVHVPAGASWVMDDPIYTGQIDGVWTQTGGGAYGAEV